MAPNPDLHQLCDLAFETDRLAVRHWQDSLARPQTRAPLIEALEPVLASNVLRDLPPSLQLTSQPNAISDWVEARARESECFLVSTRTGGDLLGLVILVEEAADTQVPQPAPTFHLGYLLKKTAWAKGYASELVVGVITALKPRAPLRLLGGVSHTNPASARVLQKSGFAHHKSLSSDDTDIFALTLAAPAS